MIVLAILIISILSVTVAVFLEPVLHARYEAWWHRFERNLRIGLDAFYQERDW